MKKTNRALREWGWRGPLFKVVGQVVVLAIFAGLAAALSTGQEPAVSLSEDSTQQSARQAAAVSPLAKLVKEAQQNNPQILAARGAWQAASQVPSQVSTLPDPEVMIQHTSAGTPIPFWDFNTVEMTYLGLGISQSLPYPGKLRLRGEVARSEADSFAGRVDSVSRSIAEQTKTTYYQISYIQKTLEILDRDKTLLEQMEKVSDARYRVGQGSQQDVLKAQLERTKLLRDIAETRQQLGSLEAQLKTLLNRPPESPDIVTETLTETTLPYSPEQLLSLVRTGNPEVATQQKMIRSKSLGVELARKDYYPDFNVQYMWEHTGTPFPDRYSLSVGISVPIYRSKRQNPELAQATAELNQSRREYEAQVQQTYFEVKDQYLAADTNAKVLKLYREGLIPQATATFQASLAAYQSGGADFQSLLESFRDVLNLDKEYWRTLADHETALARLEKLTGISIP